MNILKDINSEEHQTKTGTDEDDYYDEKGEEEELLDKDNCKNFSLKMFSEYLCCKLDIKQLCLLYETRTLQRGQEMCLIHQETRA